MLGVPLISGGIYSAAQVRASLLSQYYRCVPPVRAGAQDGTLNYSLVLATESVPSSSAPGKTQFWGSNSREKQMAMFKEERSIGGRTRNAYSLLNNTAEEKEWEAVQETSPLTNVREPKVM